MGEYNAGLAIVFLFAYFSMFILVVDSVSTLDSESYNSDVYDTDTSRLTIDYVCNDPRYVYDPTTGDKETTNAKRLLYCETSVGVLDSVTCNAIEGCTWQNITSGFLWWSTTTESCSGNINASAYDIDVVEPVIGRPYVAKQNSTFYDETTSSPCRTDSAVYNESVCNVFSCTWEKNDIDLIYNKPSTVLNVMGDVFSFRYDFGIENNLISWLLRLIFIVLPLIILIMSIYFIIPVIH